MVPVNPSNLASSVAQGMLQQSQLSRSQDAQRSNRGRYSQELKEKEKKETETVEDSFETTDEHLKITDDSPSGGRDDEGEGKKTPEETTEADAVNEQGEEGEGGGVSHLDITA